MVRSVAAHYAAPPDRVPFPPIMAAVSASDDDDPYSMRGQVYGTGYYRCADDQALILEVEPPVFEYWSFALYSQFWEGTSSTTRTALTVDLGPFHRLGQ